MLSLNHIFHSHGAPSKISINKPIFNGYIAVIPTGVGDALMDEISPEGFDCVTSRGCDQIHRA